MLIALYNRTFDEEKIPLLLESLRILEELSFELLIFKDFYDRLVEYYPFSQPPKIFSTHLDLLPETDMLVSFGGDGTMLDAVCFVGGANIPIMGINLGRLGFLADIQQDEIKAAFKAIRKGAYTIDRRTLIHLDANIPLFGPYPFALNEITLHRQDSSQMIKIHTYINGEFLNTYWADGLIVATPTGSTGYSLSCNGPLIFPQTSSFVITPVAPHNLNIRPLIVPDDSIITFEVEGRSNQFLCTLDSRMELITKDVSLAVKKEDFTIPLVRLHNHNFMKTIREKLNWGIDHRN